MISRLRTISAVTTKSRKFALRRQVVHQFEHQIFEDHAQAARAHFALQGQFGDRFERVVGEAQAHIFEFEEALILLDQRVLRLGQNRTSALLSRSLSTPTTGKRPTNSGIRP